ncbi:MAG TPA: hypothetical protein VGP26_17785 [Actinophytocola sp.]|nr:hypothetical protein [Actinophytocola sp.]
MRAGSVSVTELITRQAESPATDATDAISTTATIDMPVVPAGPTSHRRPAARGVQLAKATSLGVATIVLCGAVGVASMIAHQRENDAEAAESPVEQINGEQALLPDELDRSLTRDTRGRAKTATPPPPAPATQAPRTRAAAPPAPRGTARSSTTTAPAPAAAPPANELDVVRQFYRLLPRDPAVAFSLISPDLLHSTLGQFLDSWSAVRSVTVLGLEQRADGVLASVRILLAGGGHLQLQQLLTVADTPRRIVGVELLSAQRN